MKKILGLDIGVSSVGLALILEENNKIRIEKLAVRIIPEGEENRNFKSGKTASKNLKRTENRGIRRSVQRLKLRKYCLYDILKSYNLYPDEELFSLSSLQLYGLRAKATKEKISLQELGRVLIHLNQKRGFLSNRTSVKEEKELSEYKKAIENLEQSLNGKSIGEGLYTEQKKGDNPIHVKLRNRTYLRQTHKNEFDLIWEQQKIHYPDVLVGGVHDNVKGSLYNIIRNETIFYQRPLKSQKGLVSDCLFEEHHKAINKYSPYFEYFRIWQKINDLEVDFSEGNKLKPTIEQKKELFKSLFFGEKLNKKVKLSTTDIKKILGIKKNEGYLNFPELEGSKTCSSLKKALEEARVENSENYLFFNPEKHDEKGGLFELWHITYSLPTDIEIINTLVKRFSFTEEQAEIIAYNTGYKSEYGNLSTRAIKKLLPYLEEGLNYFEACKKVGYNHNEYRENTKNSDTLKPIKPNTLRNPVAEQILNQVVNMVNLVVEEYGAFEGEDEIRIELARELKNNAKTRQIIDKQNRENKTINEKAASKLKNEFKFTHINGRDLQRYKLWEEANRKCLYCNGNITASNLLTGQAEIEHVMPKSRSFSNNMNNFILAHRECNKEKNQMTAYDYMESKGEERLQQYISNINELYDSGKGKINKKKLDNLLCKGEDIPDDFVERMLKDTQYISREAKKMLGTVCDKVHTTTGQVTDFLREKWGLKHLLQELTLPVYRENGQTEFKSYRDKNGNIKEYEAIIDWTKRDDHRHHAIDALITALTTQKIINNLNNLNKNYQEFKADSTKNNVDLKQYSEILNKEFEAPFTRLREEAKKHLEEIFISIKKSSKVLSKSINRPKNAPEQVTWIPRGRLHEETIMGKIKKISEKKEKLSTRFNRVETIVNLEIKEVIQNYIHKYGGTPAKAFTSKNMEKYPLLYKNKPLQEVTVYEEVYTKRVDLKTITNPQVAKIIDHRVKYLVEERIKEHSGDLKKAISSLEENPIWQNKEKGIRINRVIVQDNNKAEKVRNGYAILGKNHHALIYKDNKGGYHEKVISFWEAVEIGLQNIAQFDRLTSVINTDNDPELGTFQFSMQINDLFIFDLKHSLNPQTENEIDFCDESNRKRLSEKLFRVQKMSKKSNGAFEVCFRHHLEASIDRSIPEKTLIIITSNKNLERLTKIQINHLGNIFKSD